MSLCCHAVIGGIVVVSCFIISGSQWWHCYGQLLQQIPELHRYFDIARRYWYVSLFLYLSNFLSKSFA
jgi:phenylalanine-4-hydroxylase